MARLSCLWFACSPCSTASSNDFSTRNCSSLSTNVQETASNSIIVHSVNNNRTSYLVQGLLWNCWFLLLLRRNSKSVKIGLWPTIKHNIESNYGLGLPIWSEALRTKIIRAKSKVPGKQSLEGWIPPGWQPSRPEDQSWRPKQLAMLKWAKSGYQ